MAETPPRLLVAIVHGIIRLQPADHRRRYGDEQVQMFEEIWTQERPASAMARIKWSIGLVIRTLLGSLGVHRDARRVVGAAPGGFRMRGAPVGGDIRFTWRALRQAPWYSATVVGVIAVTLALATTVFTVVDGVLFRPLPYPDAGTLVQIEPAFRTVPRPAPILGRVWPYAASRVDLEQWRAALPGFQVTGFRAQPWSGIGTGVNEDVVGVASIEPNFFEVIGVRPIAGGFTDDDFTTTSRTRPMIVTWDAWQARYAGAADVVGRTIVLDPSNGFGVRIAGIMPRGFSFPSARWTIEYIAPLTVDPAAPRDAKNRELSEVIARLPAGVSPDQLVERLGPGLAATAALFPLGPRPEGWSENGWKRQGPYDTVEITPLATALNARYGSMFRAVFAAVGLLVLIGAANISSLMASRALERQREMQMRRALGAGPAAIARLWAIEAATLITAGAAAGVALAVPLLQLMLPLLPDDMVLFKAARIDWRVAGFVVVTLSVLSLLVIVAPIRRSLGAAPALKAGASHRINTPGRFLIVGGQVAAAFVLTVLGACLVGSLLTVYGQPLPIASDDLLIVEARLQGPGCCENLSPARIARSRAIHDRIAQVPGVSSVTLTGAQLLRGGGWQAPFAVPAGGTRILDVDMWAVGAGFYSTLGLTAIEGRLPTDAELRAGAPVVVVSERVARGYWPGRSAVGETLATFSKVPYTVVGVVRDVPWFAWDTDSPLIYGPSAPMLNTPLLTFFIRTQQSAQPILDASLRAITDADPLVRLEKAVTLDSLFRESIALRRFQSWLFGSFAAAALAVTGVGILGLLAMSTARRTREIGIRCALGATPRGVTSLLVREQLIAVIAGLVAGGAIAAWAVGLVKGYVYQLSVADPRIWSAAVGLILVTAALGALVPAVRASRIDPVRALRVE